MRGGRCRGVDGHALLHELRERAPAELVAPEGGEEADGAREIRELDGRDGASARRLLPGLEGVHDLARCGDMVHACELDPFDVADDRYLHDR